MALGESMIGTLFNWFVCVFACLFVCLWEQESVGAFKTSGKQSREIVVEMRYSNGIGWLSFSFYCSCHV